MFTEQLSLVGPKDVVVAVSFSPYAREVVELVELGAQRKARQIAITDSRSARWRPSAMSALWCGKRRWMASVRRLLPCARPRRWRFRWR